MPLTHDIGVRIPYPLLENDCFGGLFLFCALHVARLSRVFVRLVPVACPPRIRRLSVSDCPFGEGLCRTRRRFFRWREAGIAWSLSTGS